LNRLSGNRFSTKGSPIAEVVTSGRGKVEVVLRVRKAGLVVVGVAGLQLGAGG